MLQCENTEVKHCYFIRNVKKVILPICVINPPRTACLVCDVFIFFIIFIPLQRTEVRGKYILAKKMFHLTINTGISTGYFP